MDSAVSICGARGGQPRFRLRHVGAGDFADIEAVAGLAKLLLQHLDVAALQIEDRGVADQVHVGGGGVEQHGLLGQPQRFARRRHQLLGLPGPAGGAKSVEQRLRDRSAVALNADVAGGVAVSGDPRWRRWSWSGVEILLAGGGGQVDARTIARQRLRNGFIGGAHRSALGIELRIVLVGLGQRPFQRVGGGVTGCRCQQPRTGRDQASNPPSLNTTGNPPKRTFDAPRTTRNTHGTPTHAIPRTQPTLRPRHGQHTPARQ